MVQLDKLLLLILSVYTAGAEQGCSQLETNIRADLQVMGMQKAAK